MHEIPAQNDMRLHIHLRDGIPTDYEWKIRRHTHPHPLIIEPPLDEKRHYSRGDSMKRSRGRYRVVAAMNIGCEKETLIYNSDSHIRDSQQMINTINNIHERHN
ncbi:MAG: hypothetical protein IMY74_01165 [Bacteroidetes bacterium]|nr:hypothetical protein [Bacteroidota bacterium]